MNYRGLRCVASLADRRGAPQRGRSLLFVFKSWLFSFNFRTLAPYGVANIGKLVASARAAGRLRPKLHFESATSTWNCPPRGGVSET